MSCLSHRTSDPAYYIEDLWPVYRNQSERHLTLFCMNPGDLALLFITSIGTMRQSYQNFMYFCNVKVRLNPRISRMPYLDSLMFQVRMSDNQRFSQRNKLNQQSGFIECKCLTANRWGRNCTLRRPVHCAAME